MSIVDLDVIEDEVFSVTKQNIIDYVMHSPHNTNRAVLKSLLDSINGEETWYEVEINLQKAHNNVDLYKVFISGIVPFGEVGVCMQYDGGDINEYNGTFLATSRVCISIVSEDSDLITIAQGADIASLSEVDTNVYALTISGSGEVALKVGTEEEGK